MPSASEAAAAGGSYFPLGGSTLPNEATATCYCGAVQLAFPTVAPGLVDTFICNCADCRKITASMFASNFIILDSHLRHVRGKEKLTQYTMTSTIESGNSMTSHFCAVCGGLMYRVSSGLPGASVLRIGTVDDFNLHETRLKPRVEYCTKDRVSWCTGGVGVKQRTGMPKI